LSAATILTGSALATPGSIAKIAKAPISPIVFSPIAQYLPVIFDFSAQ